MSDPSHSKYQVQAVFDEALNLFSRKNLDYGDAWRHGGWRGNLGRILEKADRLRTILWHGGSTGASVPDEDARQTAVDMINTLAFFVVNWDERREWGHEEDPPAADWRPAPGRIVIEENGAPYVESGQVPSGHFVSGWTPSPEAAGGMQPQQFDPAMTMTAQQTHQAVRDGEESGVRMKPTPTPRPIRDNPQA